MSAAAEEDDIDLLRLRSALLSSMRSDKLPQSPQKGGKNGEIFDTDIDDLDALRQAALHTVATKPGADPSSGFVGAPPRPPLRQTPYDWRHYWAGAPPVRHAPPPSTSRYWQTNGFATRPRLHSFAPHSNLIVLTAPAADVARPPRPPLPPSLRCPAGASKSPQRRDKWSRVENSSSDSDESSADEADGALADSSDSEHDDDDKPPVESCNDGFLLQPTASNSTENQDRRTEMATDQPPEAASMIDVERASASVIVASCEMGKSDASSIVAASDAVPTSRPPRLSIDEQELLFLQSAEFGIELLADEPADDAPSPHADAPAKRRRRLSSTRSAPPTEASGSDDDARAAHSPAERSADAPSVSRLRTELADVEARLAAIYDEQRPASSVGDRLGAPVEPALPRRRRHRKQLALPVAPAALGSDAFDLRLALSARAPLQATLGVTNGQRSSAVRLGEAVAKPTDLRAVLHSRRLDGAASETSPVVAAADGRPPAPADSMQAESASKSRRRKRARPTSRDVVPPTRRIVFESRSPAAEAAEMAIGDAPSVVAVDQRLAFAPTSSGRKVKLRRPV